jgi:hypothetical protein
VDAFDLLFLVGVDLIVEFVALVFADVDIRLLGQFFDGIPEIYPFYLLDEGDDIASFAAAEAFEDLLAGRNHEGRRLLVMERAVAGKIGS